ncbi:pancreatic secretory granule membrane major glycoprotein GP2-like [Rhinatrema bivittatum]|uniref:pancreatic secretory granule membrane major glycoprotein GP2-like n=1 Tax=Rhinatrema bivittatum TaxID=194408 RepID=UPI00112D7341|nr:pancreatic secretory granule membrane major glycoprotein GP2-like [Rhinatrema bivittatum]
MKTFLGIALTLCFLQIALAVVDLSPPCASDEYLDNGSCACNTSMYPVTNTTQNPSPVLQCLPGVMVLTISRCQLEAMGLNASSMELQLNSSCTGTRGISANNTAQISIYATTKLGDCGTNMTINNNQVIYSNVLVIFPLLVGNSFYITGNFSQDFSCAYNLTMQVALATTLHPVMGSTSLAVPAGVGSVQVMMAAFMDDSFTVPLTDAQKVFSIQDPLYLGLITPNLDGSQFSVHLNRLYATATNDSNAAQEYDVIVNGCPAPDLSPIVTVQYNGNGIEARVILKVFMIAGASELYLFGEVGICPGTCPDTCTIW